ncbi:MAG: hypothetical protein ACI9J3_000169 [Parvicellaceae bacterium]|jgi:hypothetical protein
MKLAYLIILFGLLSSFGHSQVDCPTSISFNTTDELTYAGCDGTLTMNTTGGSPPYTFIAFSSVNTYSFVGSITDTSHIFPAVCPGIYEGFIINSLGDTCILAGGGYGCGCGSGTGLGMLGGGAGSGCGGTVNPATPLLSVDCSHTDMCATFSVNNYAIASGDAPPFEYSFDGGTTWSFTQSSPTMYAACVFPWEQVMVRDVTGQTVTGDCMPTPGSCTFGPVDPIAIITDATCLGACDGIIVVKANNPAPGDGPFSVTFFGF